MQPGKSAVTDLPQIPKSEEDVDGRHEAGHDDEAQRSDDEAQRSDDEAQHSDDEARRSDDEAQRSDDEARRSGSTLGCTKHVGQPTGPGRPRSDTVRSALASPPATPVLPAGSG